MAKRVRIEDLTSLMREFDGTPGEYDEYLRECDNMCKCDACGLYAEPAAMTECEGFDCFERYICSECVKENHGIAACSDACAAKIVAAMRRRIGSLQREVWAAERRVA